MSELSPFARALDASGAPLPGAKLYFYRTGTTTPANVYTTSSRTTALPNPVVADSNGVFPPTYLDPDTVYHALLKTSAGVAVSGADFDPVSVADESVLTPEMFGAVGDGTADDWQAFVKLAAAVNLAGGGYVRLGREKTYRLDRYVTATNGITVKTFSFSGANGLIIDGNGAKLSTKGDFVRTSSDEYGIRGLSFYNCSNVIVRNLEIDGNLGQTTRWGGTFATAMTAGSAVVTVSSTTEIAVGSLVEGPGIQAGTTVVSTNASTHQVTLSKTATATATNNVTFFLTERGGSGLYIASCTDVRFENLYVHHFSSDGLVIDDSGSNGSGRVACRRVSAINCRFKFNARQAMTIVQGRSCDFVNCEFSYTGYNDETLALTSYGAHSPAAGVDVEPDFNTAAASPNTLDVNTGELSFHRCRFIGNRGATFLASEYYNIDRLALRDCELECADNGTTSGIDGFILDAPAAIVEGCRFDLKSKVIYLGFTNNTASSIWFVNNDVSGKGNSLLRSVANLRYCLVRGNRFIAYNSAAQQDYCIQITNTGLTFQDNYVYLPEEAYSSAGGSNHVAFVASAKAFIGNTYETNLTATYGGGTGAFFAHNYGSGTRAENERFKGTAPGTGDTFRPTSSVSGAIDTRKSYSVNAAPLGSIAYDPPSIASGASATTTVTVSGAQLGDRVFVRFSRSLNGLLLTGYVSAADTVTAVFANLTGAAVDLASGTLTASVER